MGDTGSEGVSEGGGHRPGGDQRHGDRVIDDSPAARRAAFFELFGLWLVTLLLIRAVVELQIGLGLPEEVLAAVPLLFIYAPVALCNWRGVDSWSYRLSIPAFRDWQSWGRALWLTAIVTLFIWPPFLISYHFFQTELNGMSPVGNLPKELLTLVAYQLFFVAIPEEFFYRGYFQTRLNEVFARRFLIFGTPMGWGSVLACLFFAFGHSLVLFQWWHFATFFPGMVFAWMRERTGGVVAGAFFHAVCNIGIVCLDTWYGLRSPFQV
ncbi:MAG: type II CAAX endopeptidase family protein [Myxococcota bacterium]